MRRVLIILFVIGWLAGCALIPRIEPGTTTEAEILAIYGPPTRRWPEADGAATLEYATQPMGVSCFMVGIDAGGRVAKVRDALSDTNLARVEAGMSPAEVDRLLGRHRSEVFFALSGETVWDWNIPNLGPGIATRFNVHFKDGRVLRTSRSFIYGGGLSDGGVIFHPPAYLPCPRCVP
jgi:hypothetical protein